MPAPAIFCCFSLFSDAFTKQLELVLTQAAELVLLIYVLQCILVLLFVFSVKLNLLFIF